MHLEGWCIVCSFETDTNRQLTKVWRKFVSLTWEVFIDFAVRVWQVFKRKTNAFFGVSQVECGRFRDKKADHFGLCILNGRTEYAARGHGGLYDLSPFPLSLPRLGDLQSIMFVFFFVWDEANKIWGKSVKWAIHVQQLFGVSYASQESSRFVNKSDSNEKMWGCTVSLLTLVPQEKLKTLSLM